MQGEDPVRYVICHPCSSCSAPQKHRRKKKCQVTEEVETDMVQASQAEVLINVTWNVTANEQGGKVKGKMKRRDWPFMHLSYYTDKTASSVHALLPYRWMKRRVLGSVWARFSKHLEIKMNAAQPKKKMQCYAANNRLSWTNIWNVSMCLQQQSALCR